MNRNDINNRDAGCAEIVIELFEKYAEICETVDNGIMFFHIFINDTFFDLLIVSIRQRVNLEFYRRLRITCEYEWNMNFYDLIRYQL